MILHYVAQSTPLMEYYWHNGTQNLSSQISNKNKIISVNGVEVIILLITYYLIQEFLLQKQSGKYSKSVLVASSQFLTIGYVLMCL